MAISLNSFSPNTKIESSKVNDNFTNVANAVADAAYRAFTWGILGTLATGTSQGMVYLLPQNVTVTKIWYKTTSGTCGITLKADSTTIKATGATDVTSAVGSTTSITNPTLTAGQVLTLNIDSISSATDLYVTMETQVTSLA